MERGSAKHGPRLDDQQQHETEGMTRGGGTTHAQEWKQPEPTLAPGEEGTAPANRPPDRQPGVPRGLTPEGADRRSDLAKWISGMDVFPADRDALLSRAEMQGAPDPIIDELRSLPNATYVNMAEVSQALGYGTEERDQG
ncbi:hypothetical protein GCM10010156_57780 [Planobispora rosea]|uniref:DUF2795 domain-containing protein n=1 Tax=Planobispora rosea TaxID=35762 RepID=A0A8J3S6X1_PLARO|nr:DUF2795 domain-containing protein [Planobispora rosea]GGS91957.1 hypothetical protein GCM10010156_57780 [Planobispora rosea]GIH87081.1 hypothetical protein Pro02_54890 [Planobispora rosea]